MPTPVSATRSTACAPSDRAQTRCAHLGRCTSPRCSAGSPAPARAASGRRRPAAVVRELHVELEVARVESSVTLLDRIASTRRRDRFAPRRSSIRARRDARHVQQVVDHPHQVADLALHHSRAPLDHRMGAPRRISSSAVRIGASGLRNSCAEHRQELVLLPGGLAHRIRLVAERRFCSLTLLQLGLQALVRPGELETNPPRCRSHTAAASGSCRA